MKLESLAILVIGLSIGATVGVILTLLISWALAKGGFKRTQL